MPRAATSVDAREARRREALRRVDARGSVRKNDGPFKFHRHAAPRSDASWSCPSSRTRTTLRSRRGRRERARARARARGRGERRTGTRGGGRVRAGGRAAALEAETKLEEERKRRAQAEEELARDAKEQEALPGRRPPRSMSVSGGGCTQERGARGKLGCRQGRVRTRRCAARAIESAAERRARGVDARAPRAAA